MLKSKSEIKKEAAVASISTYHDALFKKYEKDDKQAKLKVILKNGEEITRDVTEFSLPFEVKTVIEVLNGCYEMSIGDKELSRDTVKSIEIIFD